MPIRSAVKNDGIACGSRTSRNRCQRDAPMLRSRFVAARGVEAKPSISPMATGKKVTSAITTTLGSRPKPNQMISSGAIAMIGSVCETTSSGVSARRSHGEKSTAIAITQPSASDTANPTAVTCSVGTVLAQICSRAAHPCSATRSGEGSTWGRTPVAATNHCQATRPAATRTRDGRPAANARRTPRPPRDVAGTAGLDPATPAGVAARWPCCNRIGAGPPCCNSSALDPAPVSSTADPSDGRDPPPSPGGAAAAADARVTAWPGTRR